ncbi:hypothetical protein SLEP1_g20829 [Rubroshorea leprosula]|uniref:Uncharacterized protein n=1 Tax=Rubroshorea leprosula TaxID=152421 RepID=A0AAV5J3Y6_9ROSI|nr:hypothetical protein SLEP1_g20829 [Rubroshorea leprosula]
MSSLLLGSWSFTFGGSCDEEAACDKSLKLALRAIWSDDQ